MSYRAGIGPLLARSLSVNGRIDPHIRCDECGTTHDVSTRHGTAFRWFLDGKAPPGWTMHRAVDGRRTDVCGRCRGTKGGG